MKPAVKRVMNADACANCTHGKRWHMMTPGHARYGRCQHQNINNTKTNGVCRCEGYKTK